MQVSAPEPTAGPTVVPAATPAKSRPPELLLPDSLDISPAVAGPAVMPELTRQPILPAQRVEYEEKPAGQPVLPAQRVEYEEQPAGNLAAAPAVQALPASADALSKNMVSTAQAEGGPPPQAKAASPTGPGSAATLPRSRKALRRLAKQGAARPNPGAAATAPGPPAAEQAAPSKFEDAFESPGTQGAASPEKLGLAATKEKTVTRQRAEFDPLQAWLCICFMQDQ